MCRLEKFKKRGCNKGLKLNSEKGIIWVKFLLCLKATNKFAGSFSLFIKKLFIFYFLLLIKISSVRKNPSKIYLKIYFSATGLLLLFIYSFAGCLIRRGIEIMRRDWVSFLLLPICRARESINKFSF